jgi:N-sulfoglucosamine sulfohydrolase
MKPARFILSLIFAAVGPLLHAASSTPPAKPNLLFILTEDQGAHLGFLGTPGLQTPHMDSLARSGVYFDNAFVVYPVCSASKAAIYTGLHNHTNGILNNTLNLHKPAAQLTAAERNHPLFRGNRIHDAIPTLVERLHAAGYYQGVTSKLHVLPNEKFPYDEFLGKGAGRGGVAGFIARARQTGKPWHLFYDIGDSHRPFPNSDNEKIRVNPAEVKLPASLPDTPEVRQDWAEYLAAIERADCWVGEGLAALRAAGEEANTIVVFLGDHGPAFQHGKMTLYDLGLRTPLIIRAPGLKGGVRSGALASTLDLTPTLLDLLRLEALPRTHGLSLRPVLAGEPAAKGHDFIFAEISDRGPLPNDGMQERSVFDGRWHLIYREKLSPAWRQVQADNRDWKVWRNRTYDETVKQKERFPEHYRILAEMDPQGLGGKVSPLELYDLKTDPDELKNLAEKLEHRAERDRLYAALRQWVRDTSDPAAAPPAAPPGQSAP